MPIASKPMIARPKPYAHPTSSPISSSSVEYGSDRPDSDETKPSISTTSKSKVKTKGKAKSETKSKDKRNRGKGQPWAADELVQLFHFALERNGRSWDDAVPGRTANQASQTWKATIIPYIEKALEARGTK